MVVGAGMRVGGRPRSEPGLCSIVRVWTKERGIIVRKNSTMACASMTTFGQAEGLLCEGRVLSVVARSQRTSGGAGGGDNECRARRSSAVAQQ